MPAEQVEQRALDGGDDVDRRAQVEGLESATAGIPIALATNAEASLFAPGNMATVIGWGATNGNPPGTPQYPDTLREVCALKKYFRRRVAERTLDATDDWLRMVATNRLTGHSAGFFSVYTLPPNQAV